MKSQNNKFNVRSRICSQLEGLEGKGLFWKKPTYLDTIMLPRSIMRALFEVLYHVLCCESQCLVTISILLALQTLPPRRGRFLQISFRQASSSSWSLAVQQIHIWPKDKRLNWMVSLEQSVVYPTRDFFVEKFRLGPSFSRKNNFLWNTTLLYVEKV